MHKYYNPDLFRMCDVLTEEADLRERFAPRVSDGCLLEASAVETSADSEVSKVDITQTEHFVAAGFDVNWCGAEENGPILGVSAAGGEEPGGVTDSTFPVKTENEDVVQEDVFRRWLELREMRRGVEVQRWWANKALDEEGAIEVIKLADDESATDFFDRIRTAVISGKTQADSKVPDGGLALADLVVGYRRSKCSRTVMMSRL